jgi:hypothetical protein
MLASEPLQTADDPLRRLAQLNIAVVAISAALVVLVALGTPDEAERAALALALGAALAVVAGVLMVTSRSPGRELDERRHTERVLRESESVFRQLAENVREVFYLCEWPSGG